MARAVCGFILLLLVTTALLVRADSADAGRCFYDPEEGDVICDGRLEPAPGQFQPPLPRHNSLLDTTTYAYLEDNINIYPEPDLGLPPLYNVGEGYLFATVHGQVEANGQRWYVINPGEYALAEGVRVVETPTFHGVEITYQPQRPFGWVVQDVVPSSAPDGEPNPALAELPRFSFFQVYDAEAGEEDWLWYNIGDGRWIKQTFVSLVDVHPPPDEVGPGEFWVEVDLYEQTFAAYEGPRMVYAGLISSGLNRWPTYEGLFQVWSRYLENKMSGAEGKVDYYYIEDVPYIMYFDRINEIALHGAFWHDRYGYKHSHGCVNMPPRDAEWIFYWSLESPADLWVWVHTSAPQHYFERFGTAAN